MYGRAVRWVGKAATAPGAKQSGFSPYLDRLVKVVQRHRQLSGTRNEILLQLTTDLRISTDVDFGWFIIASECEDVAISTKEFGKCDVMAQ
jgi:hypothetical protein